MDDAVPGMQPLKRRRITEAFTCAQNAVHERFDERRAMLTGDLARRRKLPRMNPTHIDLFNLAEQRLAWTDRRQAVLAHNVANANTPGYKPHDLRPFADMLGGTSVVEPVRTQPNHLAGSAGGGAPGEVVDRAHTQSPDGNGVTLDEQLLKVADTATTHQLVTTIYKTYLGMFGTAIGRGAAG
jgi:flagellar basal-body rod protein FlgB